MSEALSIIEQAANSILTPAIVRPSPSTVVAALLEAEKAARHEKIPAAFEQFIGDWRLCLITGTQKTRQKAGIVMGAGRYIPQWIKITISYQKGSENHPSTQFETGFVENNVEFGTLKLTVAGPTKFLPNKNILAFDFTRITIKLFGSKIYQGTMRGGQAKEAEFYTEKIGKQAFFAFFVIQKNYIAARGRGGGLALWAKLSQ